MSKLREIWDNYLSRINKYWFVTLIILAPTFMLGDSSLIMRMRYDEKINELEKAIKACQEKIDKDKETLKLLNTDPDNLEKFAREQYLMKRDNEDIFLFDE